MTLFERGRFRLHSGEPSDWRINLDALGEDDLETLAMLGAALVGPFSDVVGVPRGGLRFAEAMIPFETEEDDGPLLIVDDVLTTGNSMEEARRRAFVPDGRRVKGLVAFARGICPPWVTPIFAYVRP